MLGISRPGDADGAHARGRVDLARGLAGSHLEIRDRGRDAADPRSHEARKAHQLGVHVARREFVAAHGDLIHPGCLTKDRRDHSRGLDAHPPRTGSLEFLRVADELDGVTDALFSVQEDRAPLEGLAVPCLAPDIAEVDDARLETLAPLELLPSPLVVTLHEPDDREVPVGVPVGRIEGAGAFVEPLGLTYMACLEFAVGQQVQSLGRVRLQGENPPCDLTHPVEAGERLVERRMVDEHADVVGIDGQRPLAGRLGLRVSMFLLEHDRQVAERVDESRVDLERALQRLTRLGRAPQPAQRHGAVAPQVGAIGRQRNCRVVCRQRLGEPTRLDERVREVVQPAGVPGGDGGGALERGDGHLVLAPFGAQQAEVVQRLAVARPDRDRAFQECDRLVGIAIHGAQRREVVARFRVARVELEDLTVEALGLRELPGEVRPHRGLVVALDALRGGGRRLRHDSDRCGWTVGMRAARVVRSARRARRPPCNAPGMPSRMSLCSWRLRAMQPMLRGGDGRNRPPPLPWRRQLFPRLNCRRRR